MVFPPVEITLLQRQGWPSDPSPDAIVDITWQNEVSRFVVEHKSQSTPKALVAAIDQAQRLSKILNLRPLVIVPFLPERSLRLLESEGVSGLDLAGNGVILGAKFAVRRSGQPNPFREAIPIRNIFWGTSSLIARCFLLRSQFDSLSDLRMYALSRMDASRQVRTPILTKGTVSKVVQALDEEMIISRASKGLQLANADALLERLRINYRQPSGPRVLGKMPHTVTNAWDKVSLSPTRFAATGDYSAAHYHLLSSQDKLTLYVDRLDAAARGLDITEGPLFPNVELIEEKSDQFYFDARRSGNAVWASPIQTWVELANSGPREREAAGQLEEILRKGEGEKVS
jgi:hypothetical protein